MTNELDDILDDIKDDVKSEEIQKKDSETDIEEKKDLSDDDDFLNVLMGMTVEDRKLADNYYNTFADEVAAGMDRSQASKEAMGKAIELKISSAKNIIDAKKVIDNKKDQGNKVGVVFNGISGKKNGIDINSIKEELEGCVKPY